MDTNMLSDPITDKGPMSVIVLQTDNIIRHRHFGRDTMIHVGIQRFMSPACIHSTLLADPSTYPYSSRENTRYAGWDTSPNANYSTET